MKLGSVIFILVFGVVICGILPVHSDLIFAQNATIEKEDLTAQEKSPSEDQGMNSEFEEQDQDLDTKYKICPVDGTLIKENEGYQVEYDGKTYYLCSKECEAEFKQDPEEYINQNMEGLDVNEEEQEIENRWEPPATNKMDQLNPGDSPESPKE